MVCMAQANNRSFWHAWYQLKMHYFSEVAWKTAVGRNLHIGQRFGWYTLWHILCEKIGGQDKPIYIVKNGLASWSEACIKEPVLQKKDSKTVETEWPSQLMLARLSQWPLQFEDNGYGSGIAKMVKWWLCWTQPGHSLIKIDLVQPTSHGDLEWLKEMNVGSRYSTILQGDQDGHVVSS